MERPRRGWRKAPDVIPRHGSVGRADYR
jgi:hypothetical protein